MRGFNIAKKKLQPFQKIELLYDYVVHKMSSSQLALKYGVSKESPNIYIREYN